MTNEEAMDELKSTLRDIANSRYATNARVRAAMVLAMAEGASQDKIEDMARAVGLHAHRG